MNKKNVLITGGNSGLGKSIVYKYAKNNYNVIFTYLNNESEANKIKEDIINNYNINCSFYKCDISNEEDINNLYNNIINEYNSIDILINNAGIAIDSDFDMKTKDSFIKILDTNLIGIFLLSKKFGNLMYQNKYGKIINISSTNGIDSYYEYSLEYDASKAALNNLTHNLAHHYSPYINVNVVCPGWINTPMNKDMDDEFKIKQLNKILLGRFAEPEEIANLVYFLSSDEACYINDSIIKIDGGKNEE